MDTENDSNAYLWSLILLGVKKLFYPAIYIARFDYRKTEQQDGGWKDNLSEHGVIKSETIKKIFEYYPGR